MSITDNPNSTFISINSSSKSRVGLDILAYCSRCKMNLNHTIVTVGKQNAPDRVLCNTCKTEKQYRSPKKENEMEKDEEFDLDLDAGGKRLAAEEGKKKAKAKAKAKAKKPKEEGESTSRSSSSKAANAALPLSMQEGTPEDLAQYEARLSAQKNAVANAKEYKATLRFKQGEVINHKSFGIGFVVAESGRNKLEVLFSKGRKLLATGLGEQD